MPLAVGRITPVSTTEWAGKSSAVIYLAGCNFRCPWCWTHDLLDVERCASCKQMRSREVFDYVMNESGVANAVVFDGGEPTLQAQELLLLCSLFKKQGLAVKINTNGTNAGIIGELAARKLADQVSLDMKAAFGMPRDYAKTAGIPEKNVKNVLQGVTDIFHFKHAFHFTLECRTTIVPGFVFRPHEIEEIAKEVAKSADYYTLQQFTPERGCLDPALAATPATPREQLLALAQHAHKFVKDVRIRTTDFGEEKT